MSHVFFIALSFILCISPTIYAGDINADLIGKRSRGYHRGTNLSSRGEASRLCPYHGVFHLITSSALKSTVGGMMRSRALAVLRL